MALTYTAFAPDDTSWSYSEFGPIVFVFLDQEPKP